MSEELVFDDAPPEVIRDESPATDDRLSCEVCGTTLIYAGRGRKPKRCPEHRAKPATGTRSVSRGGNEKLATQAAESLVQINRLTGLGARILGLPGTSEMIMFCEDGFKEQAYAALLTDPDLCRQILSAGQISAKFSLAVAYAMMGAQIVPVAIVELKSKKADKEAAREEAERVAETP